MLHYTFPLTYLDSYKSRDCTAIFKYLSWFVDTICYKFYVLPLTVTWHSLMFTLHSLNHLTII